MRCVQCEHELGHGAKFCPECGASQMTNCPQCATRVFIAATSCSACGTPLAGHDERRATASRPAVQAKSDAERRQLTVMFCDLVGSTAMSASLDPEDARAVIREYQEVVSREVARFGGHVAQLLGDGVLVYFGYPVAYEDAAPRAVATALAIVSAISRLSVSQASGATRLQVRIGLHTGVVVVGEMGSGAHHERLAIGDTPNIAARIQSLAEPNVVLMSDVTASLVSRRFHTEFVGDQVVKGVREPLSIFRATEARDLLDETNHVSATPMVNRGEERSLLRRPLAQAREGQGRAILLVGEGGLGKSRLMQFMREQVDLSAGERTLTMRCQSLHMESAFHPFIEHLGSAAGFRSSDTAGTRLEKLGRLLDAQAPALRPELATFAALMLLPVPADAEPIDPMALRGRIQGALEQWVIGQTTTPLLCVVSDLHWADASSLEVLQRLIAASEGRPLTLVMTARPEFEPPAAWEQLRPFERVILRRMAPEYMRSIVQNVAAEHTLPRQVIETILERADGVPIYAEELTKSVIATGATLLSDGDGSVAAIPATLQDSLMARIDRLGPVRAVAQMGAVIGRQFDYQTLLALTDQSELTLQRALVRLTESDVLIQAGAFPNAEFSFRQALLQEVTYNSLLRDTRQALHEKVGRILERTTSNGAYLVDLRADDRLRMLSHHWHRAASGRHPSESVLETAVTYLMQSGEQQLARSGYSEAESQLRRALEHVSAMRAGRRRDELELQARVRLSIVHKATVGPAAEQVREELSRCRDLCLQLGDRPELGLVLYGFWQLHLFRAQYPMALSLAEECLVEALRVGDDDLLIQAHVALANTRFWFGDLDAAREHAATAHAMYDPAKHARHAISFGMDPGVLALMFASWIPQLRGQTELAHENHQRLLQLSSALDHPLSKALALNTSCCYYVNDRDIPAARAAGEELLQLAQACGLPVYAMFGVLFRGWAVAEQGRVAEVLEEVRQTYRNYVTYVGGLAQSYAAMLVSGVYAHAGCHTEALDVVDAVLAVTRGEWCRELAYEADLLYVRAALQAELPDADASAISAQLSEVVRLADARRQPVIAARAAQLRVDVLARAGADVTEASAVADRCARELDAVRSTR